MAYQDRRTLAPPLARPGADESSRTEPDQPYLPPFRWPARSAPPVVRRRREDTARWGRAVRPRLLQPDSVAQMTDFDNGDGYGLGTMDFSSGLFSHATLEAVGHLGVCRIRTLLAVFPATALSSPS